MRWFVLALVLMALIPASAEAATLFILRHAEDLDEGRDPVLTKEGEQRAEELATMLIDSGVEFILSSDYRRTRDTVAPLAAALGLDVEIYDPRDLPGLIEELARRGADGVVVGHSNTTPTVVDLLGGAPGDPIDEMEFDRLYILTTDFRGEPTTIRLRY
jgi:broad specificity phosphatase PhoE